MHLLHNTAHSDRLPRTRRYGPYLEQGIASVIRASRTRGDGPGEGEIGSPRLRGWTCAVPFANRLHRDSPMPERICGSMSTPLAKRPDDVGRYFQSNSSGMNCYRPMPARKKPLWATVAGRDPRMRLSPPFIPIAAGAPGLGRTCPIMLDGPRPLANAECAF